MDKKIIAVLLIVIIVIVILPVLFAPIIPVQVTTTETKTVKLLSYYKVQHADNGSDYVNVTNFDTVGGTYTVTIQKAPGPFSHETFEDTTTQSIFIASRNSGIFYAPDSWTYFTHEVTIPTKEENYTVTKTEYRSIIALST
jgi:hypothetical protein